MDASSVKRAFVLAAEAGLLAVWVAVALAAHRALDDEDAHDRTRPAAAAPAPAAAASAAASTRG